MSEPTFAEYERHLAEFDRGRVVWLETAQASSDPISRELALRIAGRIEAYTKSVHAFLDHARATNKRPRLVDVRR